MATNWEKVKEELTCAICQDLLKDPRILPCLHSFCTGCLKEWLDRLPYLQAARRQLQCPVCRGKFELSTPRVVEELPSHFSAIRLVEIVQMQEQARSNKATPICQNCEEEAATFYCSDCADFMCSLCGRAHQKGRATREHVIRSIEEMRKSEIPFMLPEKAEMCPDHPNQPLELYCRCRDVLICRDCLIRKHKKHDYDMISDVVDGEKKILKEALPGIQQLIDEVEGAVNRLKGKRQDVKNKKEENLHRLDDAFHTLHAALDERKRQLQQQITQDAEGKDKGLAVKEDELCFLLSQLKSCWSFIDDKLQRGVSKDVLSMKKSMLQRRDTLKEMKENTNLRPLIQQHFPIILGDMDKMLHNFHQFGSSCEPQKCSITNMKNVVSVGKKNSFRIILKDNLGTEIRNAREIDVHVQVQYINKPWLNEVAAIRATSLSSYEGSYVCKDSVNHVVYVLVGGQQIPGSPFKVTTTMRDYTKIEVGNCQLITQYGGKIFQCPWDITTTTNDDVVLVDRDNKEIIVFDKDLKLIRTFGQGSGDIRLNDPVGVTVGHNVIAVSEYTDHVVKKFTLQGDYLSKFGYHGSGDGQFNNPLGLTFNSKGLLYVVDHNNCRVQVFGGGNHKFEFKFGCKGSNPGQFQNPCYIALDSSDQVYVTDYSSNGGICLFSDDGQFIKKINYNNPFAISLTPDNYIVTSDGHTLTVFSPTHQLITKFGTQGSQRGQFNGVYGIAVNSVDAIFVTDSSNRRFQVITNTIYYL